MIVAKAGEFRPADLEAICYSAKRMAIARDDTELPPRNWSDSSAAMNRVCRCSSDRYPVFRATSEGLNRRRGP